jgi:nucleoside phosphorylase
MSGSTKQHHHTELTFVGVSGARAEVVTFGAPSSHDAARTNLVSLDTQTGAIHCDCKAAECYRPCWHATLVEEAWRTHPAMVEVRWLSLDQLERYGKKLVAMVGVYRARTGRVLPPDLINLAAARCEWRDRTRRATAIETEQVAA